MYDGVPTTRPASVRVTSWPPACPSACPAPERPRDPEVRDQRAPVAGEQDVLRLHVAVDHSLIMRVLERLRRFADDAERLGERQPPLPRQPGAERLALDVGHGEPEPAGGLAGVEHREDVRMLQSRGKPDLALEALRARASSPARDGAA